MDFFEFEHVKRPPAFVTTFDEGRQFLCVGMLRDPPEGAPSHVDEAIALRKAEKKQPNTIGAVLDQELSIAVGGGIPDPEYLGAEVRLVPEGKSRFFPIESADSEFGRLYIYGAAIVKVDGKHQLVYATSRKIRFYDIDAGKKIKQFEAEPVGEYITVATMAASDRVVAVANGDGKVRLLSHDGEFIREISNRETGTVRPMRFSPDGKWLTYVVSSVLHLVEVDD